ncbi:UNVERIFIED_CONTAM: putative galacturonosyltransferase 12 [Sesamum angustifolium]|uniref:Hexosyltransferase n=1 Tax=Sesamum angustifolium TaxID=2727405 RepID=A0AAW2KVT7_9LAMI
MQLHISPSLRHVTVLPSKGFREFIKVKIGSRRLSYRMVPEVIYQVLEEPANQSEVQTGPEVPQTLEDFIAQMKDERPDAKTFAIKLKSMVTFLEQRTRTAKVQEYLYRHVASSSIPKQLHCLTLKLANERSTNAQARLQLPSAEFVPALVDNSYFHYVLASDNVLAASVVASSLVHNSLHPEKVVLHIITDKKTYSPMQAWFSLHPLTPAIIEVKSLHHFDWFAKGKVPVLEAMEKDQKVRSQFRGGSSAIVANNTEKPYIIAAKLQALSPKYNSLMNHIRIHLPELFPSLNKIVFLDDDIVVQTDLSPLWDINMNGKNLKSDLSLWQLGTLPPGLIAFHGHVHVIDPFWHMLGLGYQDNTTIEDAESAGVIHFNGRAKPWLDIAFPQLRPLWTKYVDFSDRFMKSCHIRAS